MHGWHHWAFWVKHQTETTGKEIGICYAKILLHALRQLPKNLADIYTAFFENGTVFNDPRPSTTAFQTFPQIFLEFCRTVHFFQGGSYFVLKILYIGYKFFFH